MMFTRPPRKRVRPLIIALIVLLAVGALLAFSLTRNGLREFFSSLGYGILSPVRSLGVFFERRIEGGLGWVGRNEDLMELENLVHTSLIDKATYLLLQQENNTLREALRIRDQVGKRSTLAKIIGDFTEGREEYLVTNRGSLDGIFEGAAALSEAGVLIGVVRTVAEDTATVRLLASPTESVTVSILPANVYSILTGENSEEYTLGLVPVGASVSIGDVVVTTGRNGLIPAGLFIGSIVELSIPEGESFQLVKVRSPARIAFLNNLLILTE